MPALWILAIAGAGIAAAAIAVVAIMAANAGVFTDVPESPEPSTWAEGKPVPTPRTEVTAAEAGRRIYVMGGFDRTGAAVLTVEAYDPESDEWSTIAPLPFALDHAAAALTPVSCMLQANTWTAARRQTRF